MPRSLLFAVIVLALLLAGGLYVYFQWRAAGAALAIMNVARDDEGRIVLTCSQALNDVSVTINGRRCALTTADLAQGQHELPYSETEKDLQIAASGLHRGKRFHFATLIQGTECIYTYMEMEAP